MDTTIDKNAPLAFTVISKEGMDLANSFELSSEETQKKDDPFSLTTDIDTFAKIDSKPKKWMKIESCINNCHLKISEEDQKNVFDSYWNNSTVASRYKFITSMSNVCLPHESQSIHGSVIHIGEKKYYVVFSLNTVDGKKTVCRICFRSILGEPGQFIKAVVAQKLISFSDADNNSVVNNSSENQNRALCSIKCFIMVSDEEKKQNFYNYWHETTIEQRCKFILDRTDIEENIRYKNNMKGGGSSKPYNCKFHLDTSCGRQFVCTNCFHIILKESICITNEILDEKWSEMSSELENGEKYNQVINHFNKFPLFESHHVTDNGNEKYLPRGLTLETMYHLYKTENPNAMNFLAYQKIVNKSKLRFLSSVVEKCLQCEVARQQSQSTNLAKNKIHLESFISSHLNGALKSHSFKTRDEKRKVHSLMVCTFKFHQSLPTPLVNNPLHYYTEPLWTYNFTVKETTKTKVTGGMFKSYVWDESQGRKTVNEIASCLYDYIQNLPVCIKTLIFYSTSCNGESRSKLLCKILSNIVVNHHSLLLIEHKFLLDGHFYQDKNEKSDWCQDVLANNVGKIEEPGDWYKVLSDIAEKNRSEVILMDNSKFYDLNCLLGEKVNSSIDGGKIDDDVTCVQYTKTGDVYFKKKWTGNFEVMYSENYTKSQSVNYSKILKNPKPTLISEKKKENLLNLFPFLDSRVHGFYQNLKTENSNSQTITNNPKTISVLSTSKLNEIADSTSDSNPNMEENSKLEQEENSKAKELSENSDKHTFDLNIVKVESNYDDSIESEENEKEENSNQIPTNVGIVKEEINIENEKTFDKEFSDDESDDDEETVESEQLFDDNSSLFMKTDNSQIKSFNEKFYENTNEQNIIDIMKNFVMLPEMKNTTNNDNSSDLRSVKNFQPLAQCSNLCYLKITPKEQERIFTNHWHTGTSESRFNFIYDTIKVGPKSMRNKKFPEEQVQFSIKFVIDTDRGPQALCKFCYTKMLCDRPTDVLTILKLKAQSLVDGIKDEVRKIETELEERITGSSKGEEMKSDISKWKTADYDCPASKLLRTEKLHKGWTQLQPCRNGCFLTIKSQDQENIYNSYWQDATIHSRYYFIKASVKVNKTRSSKDVKSARRKYYHNSSIGPQRVCKRCFGLVLGETLSFVESVLRNTGIACIKKRMTNAPVPTNDDQPGVSGTKNFASINPVTNSQQDTQISSSSSMKAVNNDRQQESNIEAKKDQSQKEQKIEVRRNYKPPRKEPKQLENHDDMSQLTIQEKLTVLNETSSENYKDSPSTSSNFTPCRIIQQIQIAQEHIHDYLVTRMRRNPLKINIQTMYSQYQKKITDPLSIGWYQNILSVNNVNYKPPFIDKCDECETYSDRFKNMKSLLLREKICERLTNHLDFSTIVYKCKFQEEESARLINSMMVCSFGFQQNFPIPSRNKSKQLSIFNLTIWQLSNNHLLSNPMFYVWTQIEGKRSANEIASCLFQYLKKLPPQLKSLIIYSSSCHGESKNKTLAQMFSYLMTNQKWLVSVDHKFTYSGHAQLKEYLNDDWIGDVLKNHSIKAEEPEDWYKNFKSIAQRNVNKNIVFMEPDMFIDFESLWKDATSEDDSYISSEAMWLKYTKNGNVFYKRSLLERHNFELLPMQGQQRFQDLLNMQLFNPIESSSMEVHENVDIESTPPSVEQCIIKSEINFEDDYKEYEENDDSQEPSSKRKKLENEIETVQEEATRSKRIRKKREMLSL
ncbi:uncharacterized protein LOC122499394 [Leptopilina heterotoma]|uniref:uncharacterized protein LOC122499394 n=1 Tax=Leptopilina heterotoma TaxID=63436 RepID=UPI001CAA028E|nr:uncharacterized protein LOC122499394 [Leptopilina heterotoma]XP_043463661.1 uncharacterized protein LOC122499394 [Leptopilina heterotoma]